MDMNEEVRKFLSENGKKAGASTLSRYGTKHFSEIGKISGAARLGKKRGKYKKRKDGGSSEGDSI